jgi:hypothetical protein
VGQETRLGTILAGLHRPVMVQSEAATRAGHDGRAAMHQWFVFGGLRQPMMSSVDDSMGQIAEVLAAMLPCGEQQWRGSGVRVDVHVAWGAGDSCRLGR